MAGPYYVDVAVGDNANLGTSEGAGNAWKDLGYAANQVVADTKVWVKASGTYTADDPDTATTCWEITVAGGATTGIEWEGYTSTPGDDGIVTVDAQDTNTTVISSTVGGNTWNAFKNFHFTQADGIGADFGSELYTSWYNCRFSNNAGAGLSASTNGKAVNCLADNNGGIGLALSSYSEADGCVSHTNNGRGIQFAYGVAYANLVYGCGGNDCISFNNGQRSCVAIGNTMDGDNNGSSTGLRQDNAASSTFTCINNILFDLNVGILADGDTGENVIARNNLFYSNTTDRTNYLTGEGDVSGSSDPFTDSANRDYTLKSGSEAIDAGFDASVPIALWGL